MRTRDVRICLWAASGAILLGSVVLLALAVAWPQAEWEEQVQEGEPPAAKSAETKTAGLLPGLKDFERIWQRPLRGPLFDPPPVAASPAIATRPTQPLRLQLLGTAVEAKQSVAMFSMPSGEIQIRGAGQKVGPDADPAEVLSIETSRVQLRHQGQTITLELDTSKGS